MYLPMTQPGTDPLQGRNPFPLYIILLIVFCFRGLKVGFGSGGGPNFSTRYILSPVMAPAISRTIIIAAYTYHKYVRALVKKCSAYSQVTPELLFGFDLFFFFWSLQTNFTFKTLTCFGIFLDNDFFPPNME